jgi:hypothetical protein
MEPQIFVNLALGTVLTAIGWLARELWSAIKELKDDLSQLQQHMPRDYVLRDDYRSDMTDIKVMLNKIFDQLNAKADK